METDRGGGGAGGAEFAGRGDDDADGGTGVERFHDDDVHPDAGLAGKYCR
jgi:hypothetical protein